MMVKWAARQYNDIKGNAKWALLGGIWWLSFNYGKKLLALIPHIPSWLVTLIPFVASVAVFLWLAKLSRSSGQQIAVAQPVAQQNAPPAFPTVSALQGQAPQINFNAKEFFRIVYYSPLTAEVENNIKIVAHQAEPGDPELFYSRFIGVGLIGVLHDLTWAYIYRSQILLLQDMNAMGGMIPLTTAKNYYDTAAAEFPEHYAAYSFESWLKFLKNDQLIIDSAPGVIRITHRGKDFLRYLAHWGRGTNMRRL